jgi:putative transposase
VVVERIRPELGLSERRVCRVVGQPRTTQRYEPEVCDTEAHLTRRIIELASKYGRYGYRRIRALLGREGFRVGKDRMERIWREEGLKVPQKQPKRDRLWFNEGSSVRLRAAYPSHVWSYEFVHDRTHDGRAIRMLTVMDEYTRECLAIDVARQLNSEDVLDRLAQLFVDRGTPRHIRSDQRPEFTAEAVRDWLGRVKARTLFIERGSPWENGYIESFNGKLRDELLDREIFYTLKEAKVLIEQWRWQYNHFRPHSAPEYRPPAPVTIEPPPLRLARTLT